MNSEMWGEVRRFVVVGITVTILHYAVYWLLMHYMEASVAFTIGYFVSFLANYYLSARYTFHKKKSLNNGIGFIAAHAFNYLLQVSLLKLMLYIGLSKTLAPLGVYAIAVPVNFVLVRTVFRRLDRKG
ncbi:MAG: GtrA family protein [Prevotella sp.]|nr:GtrA family protein [Prevotella sp.]